MTTREPNLKHCPFCGGAGMIKYTPGSWGSYPSKTWVKCINCGSEGRTIEDPEDGRLDVKKEAAKFWNKRFIPKETKE